MALMLKTIVCKMQSYRLVPNKKAKYLFLLNTNLSTNIGTTKAINVIPKMLNTCTKSPFIEEIIGCFKNTTPKPITIV